VFWGLDKEKIGSKAREQAIAIATAKATATA
jgi:hypothetical protein